MHTIKHHGAIVLVPDVGDIVTDSTGEFSGECIDIMRHIDGTEERYDIYDGSISVWISARSFADGKIKVKK